MSRNSATTAAAIVVALITGVGYAEASHGVASLAVTMTNDPQANQIQVYDAAAAWAQRFVDAPPAALAAVKAVIDGGVAARPKHIAEERRRYVEVFAASQSAAGNS